MYKLTYNYKGSNNKWKHEFKSLSDLQEWKHIFFPFIENVEVTLFDLRLNNIEQVRQ